MSRKISQIIYSDAVTQNTVSKIFNMLNTIKLPTHVPYYEGEYTYDISINNLAFLLGVGIDRASYPLNEMDLVISMVKQELPIQKFCGSRVNLNAFKNTFTFYKNGDKTSISIYSDLKSFSFSLSMIEFLDGLLGVLQTMCIFDAMSLGFALNEKGDMHGNLLFFYRKTPHHILVFYYEPHGQRGANATRDSKLSLFLSQIQLYYQNRNIKWEYLPPASVSCTFGLQYMYDPGVGYCAIFSLFWTFCFLNVLEFTDPRNVIDLGKIVQGVEPSILAQKDILLTTQRFMVLLMNEYIQASADNISKLQEEIETFILYDELESMLENKRERTDAEKKKHSGPDLDLLRDSVSQITRLRRGPPAI